MARAPDPIKEKAYELYKSGKKLIEISSLLNIPEGTVRSWKNRYKWDSNNSATLQKKKSNKRNVAKVNATKKSATKKPISVGTKKIINNPQLNDKQKLFCIYYIEDFNATKAYQRVYDCSYEAARRSASKLLSKSDIKAEIDMLTEECLQEHIIDSSLISKRVFQKYIDIAFADISDYLEFKRVKKFKWTKDKDGIDIPVVDPETGEQAFYIYNEVLLKDSANTDTSILSEVSEGKDGVKVKLLDKMKALEWLSKRVNLLSIEDKERLEMEKEKLRVMKIKAGDNEEEEVEDDGFLEALTGTAAEVWNE